jgi:hypothetical protein
MKQPNRVEAFWSRVEIPGDGSGCWNWRGGVFSSGYGAFKCEGRQWRAHRLAWTLTHGQIPDGACVCHRCDNPRCVNPSHLWLGSNAENTADRVGKGRSAYGPRNGARTRPDRILRGASWADAHPSDLYRGPRNGRAILSDEVVAKIRRMRGEQLSQSAIARTLGLSRSTVRDVLIGRTWGYLEREKEASNAAE